MEKLDLTGPWTLECLTQGHDYLADATVPGCVHTDLLKAGLIPDPYYRDNEDRQQWIGESDWLYQRTFEVSKMLLSKQNLILCCEGLDTLAEIKLNGAVVAHTDNMYRTWEWNVKEHLKEGENRLEILFRSPIPYGKQRQQEHYLHHTGINDHRIEGGNWVRKEVCNFGWDWGPMLVTAGIWKPIYLLAWDTARISDLYVEPQVGENESGRLKLHLSTEHTQEQQGLKVGILLKYQGKTLIEHSLPLPESGVLECIDDIEHIHLWWPAGMGEQPLYDLEVMLMDDGGSIVDRRDMRIGFRTLELVTEFDEWGQSFKFRANGVDFFAKGANWVPVDTFHSRIRDEDVRDLLQSAVDANMNCLRAWGGGFYESDVFYDLCDELGICVWQDFMFACSAYPIHLPEFVENVLAEATDNVKRLHHHCSLALWCGNNELEHIEGLLGDEPGCMRWDHYCMLFDVKLREIVKRCHPAASYWPASEHSPVGNRTPRIHSSDPRWGDAHIWKVWHGRKPFEWYRGSLHRFCSEFGFQSFPHPITIESFTDETDRSVTSYIMEKHQRSPMGNKIIMDYMTEWFRLPVGFENTVWVSQILQSLGIKYAVEHWRRNMPRCMGALYWQLNDCWPVASWSSIDSLLRWKTLHYEARRFFAPDMVSVIENEEKQCIDLYITSDREQPRSAEIAVRAWHAPSGELLDQQVFPTTTPARGSKQVATYRRRLYKDIATRFDLIFEIEYRIAGKTEAENMITWVKPKHLNLARPEIEYSVNEDEDGALVIDLKTNLPALWVWVDIEDHPDLRWNDQFFHLYPDRPRSIRVSHGKSPDPKSIGNSVRVRSLWDTFSPS